MDEIIRLHASATHHLSTVIGSKDYSEGIRRGIVALKALEDMIEALRLANKQ